MLSRWTHRQRQEDCHAGHSMRSGQVRYSTVSAEGACRHILLHLISSHLIPIPIPQSTARTHSKHTALSLPYPSRLSFALRLLSPSPSFLPSLYTPCRAVKLVHVADLISGSTSETISHLQAIVQDARLADAMVAIDG
jgi:hypothetical protein